MKRFASVPVMLAAVFAAAWSGQISAQTPSPAAGTLTFTKDVAPILQRSCQNCHRPDSMAPMSFLTYEDVRPWARSINRTSTAREMPPWYIDRTVGHPPVRGRSVADRCRGRDDHEVGRRRRAREAIRPTCRRPCSSSNDDIWHIGKPDLVVKSTEHHIPAAGSDWWGDYIVDTGLTEDRYLKAVETKPSPGAKTVVHHAVTYLIQDETVGRI